MAAIKRVTLVQLAVWLCALFIASTQRRDFVQLDGSGQVDQDQTANKLVTRQLSSRDSTYDRRQAQKPARFIMGIFTVVTDIKRRKLIRKALAMYKDRRICSMGSNNGELPPAIADHCELIYTFVVGANRDGPTQVLGNFSGPLLTTPPQDFISSQEPNDITFLNIKENMEEGKSSTWFNYATIIMNANDIDYAIKCDSDTYVRVDKFFNVSTEHLPRGASRTYAGKTTWSFHRNHAYMEGQFYVLSKDLAELVSVMSVKYLKGVINIEDSDIGYFVMNRNVVVHMIVLRDKRGSLPWRHPLKREQRFEAVLADESRRLFGNNSEY